MTLDNAADITFRSCRDIPLRDIHQGFCRAFSDYSVSMQPDIGEFSLMLKQRGFDGTVSRVALAGRSVVSFWLVGLDPASGNASAYIVATGTVPECRGHGLAEKLHRDVYGPLARHGINSLQLEVISGNKPARCLYEKLGYSAVRDLSCFVINRGAARPARTGRTRVEECKLQDLFGLSQTCRDWQPSWQNDMASLARIARDLVCLAATGPEGDRVGYSVLIKPTGTIAQLAVRPDRRRAGIGSAVMQSLAAASPTDTLRSINADSRDHGFQAFLARHGAQLAVAQVEMTLDL